METVNIHEAKTHLSRLIERAAQGETIIIAKAGRPLVKLGPLEPQAQRRVGFLRGKISAPDDFDTLGREEIEGMFSS